MPYKYELQVLYGDHLVMQQVLVIWHLAFGIVLYNV